MKVIRSALHTGRLYLPRKYSWYSFLLGAESTPGPQCVRKDYVNEKFQWHHRESIPRPSGCSAVPQPLGHRVPLDRHHYLGKPLFFIFMGSSASLLPWRMRQQVRTKRRYLFTEPCSLSKTTVMKAVWTINLHLIQWFNHVGYIQTIQSICRVPNKGHCENLRSARGSYAEIKLYEFGRCLYSPHFHGRCRPIRERSAEENISK